MFYAEDIYQKNIKYNSEFFFNEKLPMIGCETDWYTAYAGAGVKEYTVYCQLLQGIMVVFAEELVDIIPLGRMKKAITYKEGIKSFVVLQLPFGYSMREEDISAIRTAIGRDTSYKKMSAELDNASRTGERLDIWVNNGGQDVFRTWAEKVISILRDCIEPKHIDSTVLSITTHISLRNGKVRVSELTELFDYTERTIRRKFMAELGEDPKLYCRVKRVETTVNRIRSYPYDDISSYMEECGFVDQSHYQNEFKQIMGTTPGKFIKRVRELQSDTSMGT